MLASNDDDGAVNQVPDNLRRLYDRWSTLDKGKTDDKKRQRIAAALKDDAWMKEEWLLSQEDLEWLYAVSNTKKTSRPSKKD